MATEHFVRLIITSDIGSLSRIGEVRQNIINIQSQFLGKKLDSKHGAAQVVLEEAPESARKNTTDHDSKSARKIVKSKPSAFKIRRGFKTHRTPVTHRKFQRSLKTAGRP